MYIYKSINDTVVVSNVKPDTDYLEIDKLPEGSGILRTDLKTIWWEEPEPEPKREVYIPVETKVKAQQDRIEFLEDCIAEMAQMVYA